MIVLQNCILYFGVVFNSKFECFGWINKMEEELRCKRPGCGKKYKESENTSTSCRFHNGKPIFHDIKKGWDCWNKIVYDWDEFSKIEGCWVGKHTDEKGDFEFWKSKTVINAENALVKEEARLKTAADFNKEQEELLKNKPKEEKKQTPVMKDGKYGCANKGCTAKYFLEEENNDEACFYHRGEPIFHDLMKGWSCWRKETYDWDDFVKIPTCSVGRHVIKYKTT